MEKEQQQNMARKVFGKRKYWIFLEWEERDGLGHWDGERGRVNQEKGHGGLR